MKPSHPGAAGVGAANHHNGRVWLGAVAVLPEGAHQHRQPRRGHAILQIIVDLHSDEKDLGVRKGDSHSFLCALAPCYGTSTPGNYECEGPSQFFP